MTGTGDALDPREAADAPRRSPAVVLLTALIALEALGMAGVTALLVVDLLTSTPSSVASAVALIALAALAAVLLASVVRGILRGRSWVRPAAVTWQVLQIAVGAGSLQGADARQDLGWGLIVPSVLVLVLLFTRSVLLATRRRD
ncbi:hypothetical protein [Clavibacter michiganensis]|uniref:Hypothetical membrane protein n=1 Tax=Clavibacter michiganensis subsp. michiganensis (strain NCPPB 382) TaxID=443906 RepID=A5CPV3_CLAM3|nr:hypothetical protein [Clavibacter michiganensis]MDO4031437.1 hypothetical protein [Clavibacter michiganensis]MDO4082491.1 hypothetical protein [Clavibacter michiganensis]MDO4086586.1 hypothetical protein [Clavibacter michiganensis]MDO4097771.1 hypothetical protein [Clavibacter michiganensis]MDO4098543.1 hypothetical protein [Clavibacter michiganensis]